MLATTLRKHTARRAVHTAVNVAKIGGSMRDNVNRCYMSDNLPAVGTSRVVQGGHDATYHRQPSKENKRPFSHSEPSKLRNV